MRRSDCINKRHKYIKAAKIVTEEPEYACLALFTVKARKTKFKNIFKPGILDEIKYKSTAGNWYGDRYNPENQLARSLALLFMAELDK